MSHNKQLIALDIGSVRVGVAIADTGVKIAVPYDTIAMNEGTFSEDVAELVRKSSAEVIVVGYPRNQSGDDTEQTRYSKEKANQLRELGVEIVFQDESLTSVLAENRLKERGGAYSKADIDAEAAAIILQDYMEQHL